MMLTLKDQNGILELASAFNAHALIVLGIKRVLLGELQAIAEFAGVQDFVARFTG